MELFLLGTIGKTLSSLLKTFHIRKIIMKYIVNLRQQIFGAYYVLGIRPANLYSVLYQMGATIINV